MNRKTLIRLIRDGHILLARRETLEALQLVGVVGDDQPDAGVERLAELAFGLRVAVERDHARRDAGPNPGDVRNRDIDKSQRQQNRRCDEEQWRQQLISELERREAAEHG